jgi:hypothetical protein
LYPIFLWVLDFDGLPNTKSSPALKTQKNLVTQPLLTPKKPNFVGFFGVGWVGLGCPIVLGFLDVGWVGYCIE